jgi:predicted MFS family arabinose efflux permease
MAFLSPNALVAVGAFVLWGAAAGLLPSLLQARILHVASAGIRDTATAFFSTSFNVGIAAGALLGGALLSNIGLWALPLSYLVLLVVALVLLTWSALMAHRRRARRSADHALGSNVTETELVGPIWPVDGSM